MEKAARARRTDHPGDRRIRLVGRTVAGRALWGEAKPGEREGVGR